MENREPEYTIKITNGKILTVNGVNDIIGFDDGVVLLNTALGRLTVEGKDLKIESLTKNGGEILINGIILGVYKTETDSVKRGGFFKLFGK